VVDPPHVQANPVVAGVDAQHHARPEVVLLALVARAIAALVVAAVRVAAMLPAQDREARKSRWVETRSKDVRQFGNC
jgi:hypothetical protein